jgi:four helix bundle protein
LAVPCEAFVHYQFESAAANTQLGCPRATTRGAATDHRAISSIALNAAEAQANSAGNSRTRFESALGSLYEAQAGLRLAVAWGYFSQAAANEALAAMNYLGGRIYGLVRKQGAG